MKKNYVFLSLLMAVFSLATMRMTAQLGGTVTINSGGTPGPTVFTSFNAFVTALSANGITANLVVNVTPNSGPYNEQVTINQVTGMGPNQRITINGNNNLLTFNASSGAPWTMRLNGVDYLTVNNLQMEGTNSTYAMVLVITNASNYDTFTACTFSCPANGTSYYHGAVNWTSASTSPASGGSATGDNDVFNECIMRGGYYCVSMYGWYGSPYNQNNVLNKCQILDWYYYGVITYYQMGLKMTNNTIARPNRTQMNYAYGVYQQYSDGSLIDGNILEKFWEQSPTQSSYYAYIMYNYNYPSNSGYGTNKIRNNIIRNMRSNYFFYGFFGYYANEYEHNTLSFDNTASTNFGTVYGFYAYSMTGAECKVRNNLISITMGGSGPKYAIYNSSPASNTIDGNDIWVGGSGSNYYFGYYNANITTFTAWQAAGADANGYNLNPNFINVLTDNHPTNVLLNNKAIPLGIPFDQELFIRNPTTPDIGALEFLTPTCTGTPSMTVSGPTFSLCPGETANFSIGNLSSDIGYTYQWQWSTVSTVGPFTVVPGSNGTTFQIPNVQTTLWGSAVISCTAPGGGSITSVAQVNVAGPTTTVAPYYENFEGIGQPNRLPNCSWLAPNIGGSAKTYVTAGSNNLLPNSGTSFASFNNSSTGANYYYTNSIFLNAGVTYSASLWYQTDFSGATNWSALRILLGNAQTSGAMTQTIATTAPAVSPMYKSLSNTFTVATSGLYYVGVMANVTGAGAPNLSWDDLRIDIPCTPQLNSPVLSLTANNQTICSGQSVVLTAGGADTYTWNTGAQGAITTEFPQVNSNFMVTGTNTLTGCTSNMAIFVNVKPSPAISLFALPPTICAGKTSNLQASGAVSYTWNISAQGSNVNVNPSVNTSYAVMGTGTNGCVGNANISVSVNPLPNVNANPSTQQVCFGDALILTGTGGVNYQWISTNPAMVLIGSPVTTMLNSSATFTMIGTDANGCSKEAIFSISADPCTGISERKGANGISVFPNPTNGVFNVVLNSGDVANISVTDVTGRVLSTNIGNDNVRLDISAFAAGIYYVKVEANGSATTVKVVKD
jgi:hypothetical protein